MKLTVPARLAAASLAAVALAGCSYVNPITTHKNYSASDGTQLVVGDVSALNLIVLTEEVDAPATLIGTLINDSAEDVDLDISIDGQNTTNLTVPAGESVKLGPADGDTEVSGVAVAAPGLIANVAFAADTVDVHAVEVPVMDGTLPEYADLVAEIG
ncbi:hypothetical protein [Demequina sp. NBRC 110055]|uniref:hypothetical protein n=1 Tax=Demequina sp. NBRC 110055 TaxID=1570344 RepID=UPI000A06BBD9|nr:hypothetical protein [Demequina sp. NBRC 110055]